jgi:hypothetical protein
MGRKRSDNKKIDGLEIKEDMNFQQKEWTVERFGWILMFLLILLALIGVFGVGPVSATTLGGEDGALWIEYERFGRFKSPATLRIHPSPEAIENGEVVFWVEAGYLKNFQIEYILPNPDSVEIGQDQYIYHFTVDPQGEPDVINFYMQTEAIGSLKGNIGHGQDLVMELSHFIFP